MECCRQLDLAGRAPSGRPLIRLLAVFLFLGSAFLPAIAQAPAQETNRSAAVDQLFAEGRWHQIVCRVGAMSAPSAELDYYYGTALAKLGRWDGARRAFLAGHRLQPYDKRLLIELAGVDFKQKRYAAAAKWLQRALRLDSRDAYANDFLGTVYFLQGNLEAALKYWNRMAKPEIENVRLEPELRVDAVLLDRAFAFSPGSTLELRDLLTAKARVRALEIFSNYAFDLDAREDGKFDLVLRARERNGWGGNKWEAMFSLFRGIFQQTVYPEYFNLDRSAINIVSLVRWDAEKRRLAASVAGPLEHNAKFRYDVGLDLRNENWDIRGSFTGPAPLLGALNLRKEAVSAGITSFESGRWVWSTGLELSQRDFQGIFPGSVLTPALLSQGYQLKHLAEFNYQLWRVPESRFVSTTGASSQIGRIWSQPAHSFFKLQGWFAADWLPQSSGDDYEMQERVRFGRTFGQVPFDELFMLGMERDNGLWLRAHIGTRDGRKGSAPLGGTYALSNWEIDKNLYKNGFLNLKVGPFLDTGKIADSSSGLGSQKWLWDTGVQAKVRALGVGVIFSYGKDLRSGNNIFYVSVGR
jgi:hypothetical protein